MEHGEPASIAAVAADVAAAVGIAIAAVVAAAVAPQLLPLQPFVCLRDVLASKKETQPETKLELLLHVEPNANALRSMAKVVH